MICEHCGTGHDTGIQRFDDNAYHSACRDALKSRLASMTKRAEDLEIQHTRDQLTIGLWRGRHEVAEAKLAERDAEIVELKTYATVYRMEEYARALREIARLRMTLEYLALPTNANLSAVCGCYAVARYALAAARKETPSDE